MRQFKRKLMPFTACDISAIEKWLSDMAQKGLIYESSGYFSVRFAVSKPVKRRYRLEYADVIGGHITDEKRAMYEESGWTAVDEIILGFVVLYTDDADAPEPYNAPETVKPLEKIKKRQTWIGIIFILMFLLTKGIGSPIGSLISGDRDILLLILNIGTIRYAALCLLGILLLTEGILRIVRAKRLGKYIEALKNEEAVPKLTGKSCFGAVMKLLTLPLVLAWILQLWFFDPNVTLYEMAKLDDNYPFPMLSEINAEEGEALNELSDHGAQVSARERSDFLAPETVELFVDYWGEPNISYWVKYYELRNEKLAEEAYDELVYSFTAYTQEELASRNIMYRAKLKSDGAKAANEFIRLFDKIYDIYDELTADGADDIIYLVDKNDYTASESDMDGKHYQHLIIRCGNKLINVRYLGESDLKDYTELYASYIR